MINFTVGPVQTFEDVLRIGGQQVPYFRTEEFSEIMFENENLIKKFAGAPEEARVAFITGSGTASMEASVINFFDERDKILVINGGSFGQRFVDICRIHKLDYTELRLPPGKTIRSGLLDEYSGKGFTGLLINIHETSTGVHYNPKMIGDFCRKNDIFLVVDAVSSFLADTLNVQEYGINVMITGSQKALACPPGVSLILLDKEALDRLDDYDSGCMYLDIKSALKDGERGQTPFTPAVGTLLQINRRLKDIEQAGGVDSEISRIGHLADYFRNRIKDLPYEIFSDSLSNAVTPLHPLNRSAYDIFLEIKRKHGMWICPNGGELRDTIFRVGHLGNLKVEDFDLLVEVLKKI